MGFVMSNAAFIETGISKGIDNSCYAVKAKKWMLFMETQTTHFNRGLYDGELQAWHFEVNDISSLRVNH